MSVIPQEDSLIMSFAEASRVFNSQQSNTGSFVPGTGDAGNQAPLNSYLSNSNEPYTHTNAGGSSAPPLLSRASQSQGQSNAQVQRPFEVAEGLPAVVPPTLPTREDVANNPEKMVEIRSPATGAGGGAPMMVGGGVGAEGMGEMYEEDEEHCESTRASHGGGMDEPR
ncbi:hypothetical protein BCR35DRAFT_58370 [Leucosporidium creatinivorum]|uniref:Uncharacterized protein n=1 Tax=Leucosporidium creatinivorum TaxID=106004 RepID=A0A1Y2FL37_9BASI|nr:hypothetical protein BCR35DRAFT_58370 [Leucosporidium creatinivorum]